MHVLLILQHVVANVVVQLESDIGLPGKEVHCKTHLGKYINIGDIVMGWDTIIGIYIILTTIKNADFTWCAVVLFAALGVQ